MKLYIENNQITPAVQVLPDSDPAPIGYTEKSSIEDWYNYGMTVLNGFFGFNYLTWRKIILGIVITKVNPDYSNWASGLTSEEKDIACKLILAPYALRVSVVGDDVDKENWLELIITTQGTPVDKLKGRAKIVEMMREKVGDEYRTETMVKDDIDDFYRSTDQLLNYFIAANTTDFKDWLCNTVGSDYENDGFAQKLYYSVERRDYLMAIYNGEY